MNLSHLYTYYLGRTNYFSEQASTADDWTTRDSLKSLANDCHTRTTEIAHCIVMFGDQELNEMNFAELMQQAEVMHGALRALLLQGIRLAKRAYIDPAPFTYVPTP